MHVVRTHVIRRAKPQTLVSPARSVQVQLAMARILRVPQISLSSLLAEQNPHIDLKLDPFDRSTKSFLQAVTAYRNRSIALIQQQRTHQANEKKKILDRIQEIDNHINQFKGQEAELVDNEWSTPSPLSAIQIPSSPRKGRQGT